MAYELDVDPDAREQIIYLILDDQQRAGKEEPFGSGPDVDIDR